MIGKTCIILLNWNGWRDTIECLESVFRTQSVDYRVVVCDNDSEDGSVERIKDWAAGRLEAERGATAPLGSDPAVPKPIPFLELDRAEAEQGALGMPVTPLVLIRTGGNLGFAGGNNVGLRYALARGDAEYVWLLNNDTVVASDALQRLLDRHRQGCGDLPTGICGSTLLFYHQPEVIQALCGAIYNPWLGVANHLGVFKPFDPASLDVSAIEGRLDYVTGASMLVSRPFLQDVGLLCEDYFLYFEEIDWALRAKGRYGLAYATDSIVFHKEGASIGPCSDPMKRSKKSDYYNLKNRLVFARKFHPWTLPTVLLGLLVVVVNRLRRGQPDRAAMVWTILKEVSAS